MIVLKGQIYNPKIDYLIMRNLILLPFQYDELRLRKVYKGESNFKTAEESSIVLVKSYFLNHSLQDLKNEDIFKLYSLITKDIIMEYELDFSNLINLALSVNKLNIKDKLTLFKISLLKFMYEENSVLIIPYRNQCRKLFIACVDNNIERVIFFENRLVQKVKKYHHKHTLEYNGIALKIIEENMKLFVEKYKLIGFGLYGSYALGKASIYSDLDIVILVDNYDDIYERKRQFLDYWKNLIEIPIDFLITTKEDLETQVKKTIRETVKIMYEV